MSRVFTVDQAAEYLHVTPYTIRKWLRKGKIPGRKIGRIYRILETELEMVLRASKDDFPEFLEPDVSLSSEDAARAARERVLQEERRRGSLEQARKPHPLLNEMVRRIREAADPERIILFGSRARGDAREDSDFDLLVVRESDEPRYRRSATLFSRLSDLPVEVEVVVYTPDEIAQWRNVPQAFITRAVRDGKVLYERPR